MSRIRTANDTHGHVSAASGTYTAGAGSVSRPNCLTSPTTPITTDGTARPKSARACDERKIVSGFPSALSPGQDRFATDSLTTTPCPGERISSAENQRP